MTSSLTTFLTQYGRGGVNCTLVQGLRLSTGRTVNRGIKSTALLFLDHGTRRGERSASSPARSLPPGKTQYPLYRRLDGHQGRSRQVRKISSPPEFDPRTVQPVVSRYTDWTIPAHYPHNIRVVNSLWMRWAGYIRRIGENLHTDFRSENVKKQKQLPGVRPRCEYSTKTGLKNLLGGRDRVDRND